MLGKVCTLVAGDEARHEEVYKRFVGKLMELDPPGAVTACAQMMKAAMTMPARLMSDGIAKDLFAQFAAVAQRIGAYTARDYVQILDHLIAYWRIPHLTGLSGQAAVCQDYLGRLAQRYRSLAERMDERLTQQSRVAFSWIFGRSV